MLSVWVSLYPWSQGSSERSLMTVVWYAVEELAKFQMIRTPAIGNVIHQDSSPPMEPKRVTDDRK